VFAFLEVDQQTSTNDNSWRKYAQSSAIWIFQKSGFAKKISIGKASLVNQLMMVYWWFYLAGVKQVEPKKRSRRFYVILTVAILTLAIIIGVVIFEWSNLGQTSYGPGPVEIEVKADKPFYLQGEDVNFTIYVNNPQDWPVLYPSMVDYRIENGCLTKQITLASPIPLFPAQSRTLYDTYFWDQKVPAPPGNYTLNFSFGGPVDYGSGGNCTFEIRPTP
jgi:hypothetical protein